MHTSAWCSAHIYVDVHRWPRYVKDWTKPDHDGSGRAPSETLNSLFSDATIQNRMLSHHVAQLTWGATPAVRLAVIEAIEEAGNVLLALTNRPAKQMQQETGAEPRYCGQFHFQLESGRPMNND